MLLFLPLPPPSLSLFSSSMRFRQLWALREKLRKRMDEWFFKPRRRVLYRSAIATMLAYRNSFCQLNRAWIAMPRAENGRRLRKEGWRAKAGNLKTIERGPTDSDGGRKKKSLGESFENIPAIFFHTYERAYVRFPAISAKKCGNRAAVRTTSWNNIYAITYFNARAIVRVRFEGQTIAKGARKRSVRAMELIFFELEPVRVVVVTNFVSLRNKHAPRCLISFKLEKGIVRLLAQRTSNVRRYCYSQMYSRCQHTFVFSIPFQKKKKKETKRQIRLITTVSVSLRAT